MDSETGATGSEARAAAGSDGSATPTESDASALSAYAELVRVPNLFTAPPDVVLGAALAAASGRQVAAPAVGGLAAASVLLYAAGTTLNDYFDADRDARERPGRPIPSGRVSRRAALVVGAALLVAGVAVAYAAGGPTAAGVSAALAATIVLYDGALKGSAVGFLAMGGTRALNVVLGVAAAGTLSLAPAWLAAVPLVVGLYVASVTYVAAEEATGVERRAVVVAGAGATGATVAAVAVLWVASPASAAFAAGVVAAAAFLLWTGRAIRAAYADPVPATVGPTVGTCVLALVVLDAAFAAVAGLAWTAAAVAFLVPAIGLSRAFDVS